MDDLHKKYDTSKLRQVSLSLIWDERKILLAMKKRGFGEGLWNGYGGKQKESETIEETAIRETNEEIGINSTEIEQVGTLSFFFEGVPLDQNWNQKAVIFRINKWVGDPVESEEMKPKWFDISNIPYDKMWPDDRIWLPKILKGMKLECIFVFDADKRLKESNIKVL